MTNEPFTQTHLDARRRRAAARKAGEVHTIVAALAADVVGELSTPVGGNHAIRLDETDQRVVALHIWYRLHGLPVPDLHVLYVEAGTLPDTVDQSDLPDDRFEQLRHLKTQLDDWGAWSVDTTADPAGYRAAATSAHGQCAITSVLVQELLGGDLVRVEVTEPHGIGSTVSHYYNVLDDGTEVDLTRGQFASYVPGQNVTDPQVRTRDYVLSHSETERRYRILKDRVDALP